MRVLTLTTLLVAGLVTGSPAPQSDTNANPDIRPPFPIPDENVKPQRVNSRCSPILDCPDMAPCANTCCCESALPVAEG